jgi:hypothetical protein
MDRDNKESTQEMDQNDPKPYSKPQVTIHGNLEEITQALGSGSKDGLNGSTLI